MARPKALIVGGGSKFGAAFSELASADYEVHVITGSNCDADRVIKVDWHFVELKDILPHIDKDYDLILFNQNGGGSPNGVEDQHAYKNYTQPLEFWNRGFFNNVQLSYYIVRHMDLKSSMKICWMLTPLFHPSMREYGQMYGGYGGDKAYNFHIMKTFSYYNDASFYGIVPKHFGDEDQFSLTIYNVIKKLTKDFSGMLIDEKGDIWGE